MNDTQKKIIGNLRIFYFASILVSVIIFLLTVAYTEKYNISAPDIILERYGIILTLLGIPLSLKIFHDKVKKMQKENNQIITKRYKSYYLIRLLILELIYIFNIISLYFTGSKNFFYMLIVVIFAFFLCAPQKAHIATDDNQEIENK